MKILIISQFIRKLAGGAEKSTIELLRAWLAEGHAITILTSDDDNFADNTDYSSSIKPQVTEIIIPQKSPTIAPFINYYLFKCCLRLDDRIDFNDFDKIIIFDFWGKALLVQNWRQVAANRISIFVRSETDYLVYKNYNSGFYKLFWYCWFLFQYPFFKSYCQDTKKIIRQADVISNSKFVASKVMEVFGVKSDVIYPFVDVAHLKQGFKHKPQFVTFIGDSKSKGIDLFYYLVEQNPKLLFRCVTRNHASMTKHFPNLQYQNWTSNMKLVFQECCVLLVPSQWEEAYGRVAREAYLMKIPLLCSKIGGLPEAVDGDEEFLVSSYKDFDEWNRRLQKTLSLN